MNSSKKLFSAKMSINHSWSRVENWENSYNKISFDIDACTCKRARNWFFFIFGIVEMNENVCCCNERWSCLKRKQCLHYILIIISMKEQKFTFFLSLSNWVDVWVEFKSKCTYTYRSFDFPLVCHLCTYVNNKKEKYSALQLAIDRNLFER